MLWLAHTLSSHDSGRSEAFMIDAESAAFPSSGQGYDKARLNSTSEGLRPLPKFLGGRKYVHLEWLEQVILDWAH